MRRHACLLVVTLALAAACRSGARVGREPENQLERSLFFVESPQRGDDLPISAESADAEEVERVVEGATVDENSTVEVRLQRDRLFQATGDVSYREAVEGLDARRTSLEVALAAYEEWLDLRAETIRLYEDTLILSADELRAYDEELGKAYLDSHSAEDLAALSPADRRVVKFIDQRDKTAAAFSDFMTPIARAYIDDEEAFDTLDEINETRDMEGLDAFLRGEIAAYGGELQALVAEQGTTLRLEAFLLSGTADPVAIHLPGYDSLDEQRVHVKDAWGIDDVNLTELAQEMEEAGRLAEGLERVRRGEASLEEAFEDTAPELAERLGELEATLDHLREELGGENLKEHLKSTRIAAREFLDDARDLLAQLLAEEAGAMSDRLDERVREELDDLERELASIPDLIRDLRALRRELEDFDFTRAPSIARRLQRIHEEAAAVLDVLERLLTSVDGEEPGVLTRAEGLRDDLLDLLRGRLDDLPQEIADELGVLWEDSDAQDELRYWRDLGGEAKDFAETIVSILRIATHPVLPSDSIVPEAFDVPVQTAEDTRIDLRRAEREVGDHLVLRATLVEDGAEVDSVLSEFEVARYGWHGSVGANVVLARPDQLVADNEEYRFSPIVTWVHHYYPDPTQDDGLARFLRSVEPGIGLHGALLNFTDDDPEIGLGLSVHVWKSWLQVGAGYNFMAETSDEGQFYYYVGSNLIQLVEAVAYLPSTE